MIPVHFNRERFLFQSKSITSRTCTALPYIFPFVHEYSRSDVSLNRRSTFDKYTFKVNIVIPCISEFICVMESDHFVLRAMKDNIQVIIRKIAHWHIHRNLEMLADCFQKFWIVLGTRRLPRCNGIIFQRNEKSGMTRSGSTSG